MLLLLNGFVKNKECKNTNINNMKKEEIKINTITDRTSTDTAIDYNKTYISLNLNRKQYEEDLERKQKEHLDNIQRQYEVNWQPCMHDACTDCCGTGIRRDGGMCVHGLSCPCPKCTPSY